MTEDYPVGIEHKSISEAAFTNHKLYASASPWPWLTNLDILQARQQP
jgi:hypothetical protein